MDIDLELVLLFLAIAGAVGMVLSFVGDWLEKNVPGADRR